MLKRADSISAFVAALSVALFAALSLSACTLSSTPPNPTSLAASRHALLQPWMDVTGAQLGTSQLGPPGVTRINLRRPTAISVRNNDIYVIDAGLERIFRYNRDQQTLLPYTNLAAYAGMTILAAPDRSVYIADPRRAELMHFAWDGTQLPSFVSPGNLARPVAVAVDERSGQILVADGLHNQFIIFSSLGMTLSVVKPAQALAIAGMASGPDGIYVTDRVTRRVVVLKWDGSYLYELGVKQAGDSLGDSLGDPGAIAVSEDNLVFVGDNFDRTIKVYQGKIYRRSDSAEPAEKGASHLVTKVGGEGAAFGNFSDIGGLAVDGNMLYVTDSLNARLHIMLRKR